MEVRYQPGPCRPPAQGSVVTVGAYDGVHIGHRRLISLVRTRAAELGCASAVVTFDRHPATVVRPDSAPKLLTDLDQKLELLAGTGIDLTLVVRFDEARAEESAEEFVDEVLVGCVAARRVVVGKNFHFGHQRAGNVPMLGRVGAEGGFTTEGVDLFGSDEDAGPPVSSTRIRGLLEGGAVEEAARLLGRPHQVRGVVGEGDRRGRDLGFPTANVEVPADILVPADGVYAGWYRRPDGAAHPAALSIGRRPTFYDDAAVSLLEAYLLDFDGDLYGEAAAVDFVAGLRGQRRFASAEELAEAMDQDVAAARRVLA
jgi:riboflavin kinase / FMN adenylyltransferase